MHRIPSILPVLILLSFLGTAGCSDADRQPKERAERLALEAAGEIEQQRYEEAERLLAECVDLHAEAGNDAKLAEVYATLSTVQTSAGKLSPALETLTALRDLYRSAADRTAELHAMFQMARLHFRLGNTAEAVRLLQEAFTNASLFRLERLHALAGMEAGSLLLTMEQYQRAIPFLTAARKYFLAHPEPPNLIETNTALITAYAAIGASDAAASLFQQSEALLSGNAPALDRPRFYRLTGDAFLRAGDAAFARANYLQAISILKQNNTAGTSQESILALLKLGELYFSNFSFPEAQQYYVAAYNLAQSSGAVYLQAFLLTRISDCLFKASVYSRSRDGMIRSSQLYEQASTLFARMGFGLGEAVTTHRLGLLKELSGDEGAAVTFYKRAFEKYLDNTAAPVHYSLPVPVELLFSEPSQAFAPNDWFSERLIGLLLKYKRTQEALLYHETMRSIGLQQMLNGLDLEFRDPGKRARYRTYMEGLAEKQRLQLELFHVNEGNRSYSSKLLQRLKLIRSKVESDAVTLMREYPVFSFAGLSPQSVRQSIDSKLPPGTAVLDFCLTTTDAWAFVIRPGQPVDAVKLSAYGSTVRTMMERYCTVLAQPSVTRTSAQELAADLHSILMRPFAGLEARRLVIIPPVGVQRFPFHSLTGGSTERRAVSYIPHLAMINSAAQLPRFINTVVSFGFTPDFRWGLEFELRDTRSFFRNTQVVVNQSATAERLGQSFGEILQFSAQFRMENEDGPHVVLSDGTTSRSGTALPASLFTSVHPFQMMLLSDVRSTANDLTELYPLLCLLNGSAAAVVNHYPVTPAVSKGFGEQFFSSMSLELDPASAYMKAIGQLERRKEWREGFSGASYFYYGIR
ncbi:MAG: hypothetical protein HUU02_15185 [Bacteroidetes bacterium]|nr:hypothetical protein [Bacteroidota bacterium]